MAKLKLLEHIGKKKIVMGMLHLGGDTDLEVLERLKREYDVYVTGGVDGVVVENYFNTCDTICLALDYLSSQRTEGVLLGVNCLRSETMGLELGVSYRTDFVQLDSVVGHVEPRDEPALMTLYRLWRQRYTGYVLGGVRFKKQPVLSDRPLEEDLRVAQTRCDAVCVTQDRTGQETSVEKIAAFRAGLGSFPLLISAGVTPENASRGLAHADGVIAGSWFKDTHEPGGEVCEKHVRKLVDTVAEIAAREA
jgi:uncharacterized protein